MRSKKRAVKMLLPDGRRPGYAADGETILAGRELLADALTLSGDRLLLSFSCGKDSLAVWLWLREVAPSVTLIPYFLYWIPGLSFVDAALSYYEEWFGCHIMRLPHPIFYQYLRAQWYQPPELCALLQAFDLPSYDFADVDKLIGAQAGPPALWTALGFRAKDNIDRRNLLLQNGPIGTKKRRWYWPLWDWDVTQTAEIIRAHKIKLSAEYKYWGRTLAAFDYQYLKPLAEQFPADFERIRAWFPLIDLELFRYEAVGRGGGVMSSSGDNEETWLS